MPGNGATLKGGGVIRDTKWGYSFFLVTLVNCQKGGGGWSPLLRPLRASELNVFQPVCL